MNRVILVGNLGQNPELRSTKTGTAVCNLSLATSRRFKDRDGNPTEEVQWHRIVVWDKQAEACAKYLRVGSKVALEGDLQYRKWQDKNGENHTTAEVVARSVEFLTPQNGNGPSESNGRPSQQPPHNEASAPAAPQNEDPYNNGSVDDLPF